MAREKKDGHFLNCFVKKDIWDTICQYSKDTYIPKTAIVEIALEEYFERNRKKNEQKDGC